MRTHPPREAEGPELDDALMTFETVGLAPQVCAGWLSQRRNRERRTGFEPATPSLGSSSIEIPRTSGEGCERPSSSKSEELKDPDSPTDEA